jgi:hypothetical protein
VLSKGISSGQNCVKMGAKHIHRVPIKGAARITRALRSTGCNLPIDGANHVHRHERAITFRLGELQLIIEM